MLQPELGATRVLDTEAEFKPSNCAIQMDQGLDLRLFSIALISVRPSGSVMLL
jgi:hypothetical protein